MLQDFDAAPSASEAPSSFVDALFRQAAEEDLARYARFQLVALASQAWALLTAPRRADQASVRIIDPSDPALAAVSVIEAVNDDTPFLLDSALAELSTEGVEVQLVAHPIFRVARDESGAFQSLAKGADDGRGRDESLIHIHVDRLIEPARRERLRVSLEAAFGEVRRAAADRESMAVGVRTAIADLRQKPPALAADEIAEAIQFLEWMLAGNFIFLGVRSYAYARAPEPSFDQIAGSGLGILQDPDVKVLRRGRELVTSTPEVLEFMRDGHALIIAKANVRSRVHRRVHMDYVGLKRFDDAGRCIGEMRIVGLFTAVAYTQPTNTIPYIRHKVARVVERLRLDPESHSGRMLIATLETYPRDELFQIDVDGLVRFVPEIAALQDRPRLRVLTRIDRFDRFASVLVFIPRDRFDSRTQARLGAELARIYEGRVSAVYPSFPEGPLVRIHYIIGRDEGRTPDPARALVEAAVAQIVRTWDDRFRDRLFEEQGSRGLETAAAWSHAFPLGYRDCFDADQAIHDLAALQRLSEARPYAVALRHGAGDNEILVQVFSRGRAIPLSDRAPMLEAMGFLAISERTFELRNPEDGPQVWLHDVTVRPVSGRLVNLAAVGALLQGGLMAVLGGLAESDGFNALILDAGMTWREVAALRALSRYLRQIGVIWSQSYMWQTLTRNPLIAEKLIALFSVKFDPQIALAEHERAERRTQLEAAVEGLLRDVASLDEERILRRFLNLVQAAVRTNFFQNEEAPSERKALAIKFESGRIAGLPAPRPKFEITVCSPQVEGVHLRFGRVARGGLRWSDRPQDFRTEVLGLVKAQQVKNAVIVPVGAKGGFVAKLAPPPSRRDDYLAEGVAAYKLFVGALLDVTDNMVDGVVTPPTDVLRSDEDDPYLVVAADKGTATFSDIANAIAVDRGFWLDDAFASGGSAGYDHKKMGITARGAWEAVKRHFREMDRDIQTSPFTVVGVGDMSGDVFGNGMLLSRATRLLAAFDHRDIFIDPAPNPELSYRERARLFALPRSSWQDYDRAALSPGGGVYARTAKALDLSPEARAVFDLPDGPCTPDDLLSAILRAPADLLWFGGIGTYVRASEESDADAGDRANDAIRIRATDLRCRVVGEGANLGLTQRARIEASRRGVRLNTDAIDNSAGVNTSDLEVNVKVALFPLMRSGQLERPSRDQLLESMTDDVAALALSNNILQTLALSLAERRGTAEIGPCIELMRRLESKGRLDRALEFLPTNADLRRRAQEGQGLTRPELAVLLAYAKLAFHDELLEGDVHNDSYFERELFGYFPTELRRSFPESIRAHRLKREIIATQLANEAINRCGPTAVAVFESESGARALDVVRAYALARDVFDLTAVNAQIDELDGRLSGSTQLDLYAVVRDLLGARLRWFLRHVDFDSGLDALLARFAGAVRDLEELLVEGAPPALAAILRTETERLTAMQAPLEIAERLARVYALTSACDLALVAERSGRDVRACAPAYFALDDALSLDALVHRTARLTPVDHFEALAVQRAVTSLENARRTLASSVLAAAPPGLDAVAAWLGQRPEPVDRVRLMISELLTGDWSLAKSVVAAGLISELSEP